MSSIDDFKGQILELYNNPDTATRLKLTDIIAKIEKDHGVTATPARYKARLKKWGFKRNTSRSEVLSVLREQEKQGITIHRDPTESFANDKKARVERYRRKNRIRSLEYSTTSSGSSAGRHAGTAAASSIVSPVNLQRTPPPDVFNILEKFGYELRVYIKSSFDSKIWRIRNNQNIIISSEDQDAEVQSLMKFGSFIQTGCSYFAAGDRYNGGVCWRQAFDRVETLVKGDYHDHLFNIVTTINDLRELQHPGAAEILKSVASNLGSSMQQSRSHPRAAMYRSLGKVSLEQMPHLEEIIIGCFIDLFEHYLGDSCYNTFVMHMDMARRRLRLGDWVDLSDVLPALSILDHKFGVSDRRPLDVIRIRVATLFKWGRYLEAREHSIILTQRASLIRVEDDPWQRHYFMIKGLYYAGKSSFFLGDHGDARDELETCFNLIESFYTVKHNFAMFDAQKEEIVDRLLESCRVLSDEDGIARWGTEKVKFDNAMSSIDNTGELFAELQIEGQVG